MQNKHLLGLENNPAQDIHKYVRSSQGPLVQVTLAFILTRDCTDVVNTPASIEALTLYLRA